MADQTKSVMIGVFVLAAFSIIIFMMLFLHPNIGNEGKILRVRFADIDKIIVGTRVTFGGKPVGEVIEIKEINPSDVKENDGFEDGRLEYNGVVYVYELTLAIDTGIEVFTTDEITARTSGLLGEKSVSIMPVAPHKGEVLIPVTNQVLYSTETGTVESTLKEFKDLSNKIELALDGFIDAFDKLRKAETWENAGIIAQNLSDITSSLKKGEGTIGKLLVKDDVYNDILATTNKIKSGEGTLGKIIYNDELYLRMASLFSKAEVILNDVNHYGVLFHLDKGWKRLRARRMNLMQQLCTPQEFRNYFNDEIDSITTSIERVSLVLQKSDEIYPCGYLLQNPEYVKVYAELLRRVGTLEEYLEMYNQQVVDTEVRTVEFLE